MTCATDSFELCEDTLRITNEKTRGQPGSFGNHRSVLVARNARLSQRKLRTTGWSTLFLGMRWEANLSSSINREVGVQWKGSFFERTPERLCHFLYSTSSYSNLYSSCLFTDWIYIQLFGKRNKDYIQSGRRPIRRTTINLAFLFLLLFLCSIVIFLCFNLLSSLISLHKSTIGC